MVRPSYSFPTPPPPELPHRQGVHRHQPCHCQRLTTSISTRPFSLFMRLLLFGLVPSWCRELFLFRHLYSQRILFKFISYSTLIHSIISSCLQRGSVHIDAIHEDFRYPLLDLTIGKAIQMFGIPLTEWVLCREAQPRFLLTSTADMSHVQLSQSSLWPLSSSWPFNPLFLAAVFDTASFSSQISAWCENGSNQAR